MIASAFAVRTDPYRLFLGSEPRPPLHKSSQVACDGAWRQAGSHANHRYQDGVHEKPSVPLGLHSTPLHHHCPSRIHAYHARHRDTEQASGIGRVEAVLERGVEQRISLA